MIPSIVNHDISFDEFQAANLRRQTVFVNKRGLSFEPYNLFETAGAASGEAGELTNFCKKIRRGDIDLDDAAKKHIGDEIADVITYLTLVANKAGINLNDAVIRKFNEVSDRIHSTIKL